MELKIEDLKYRDILVHKETGAEYEVMGFDNNEIIFSSGEVANDLKYFKKKEQSQYTFDDLIDVAVQAAKDKVIGNLFIGDTYVDFDSGNDRYGYDITCLSSGINFIKSLYKETFVIECADDIKRIKNNAKIKLNGGQSIKFINDNGLYNWFVEGVKVPLSFDFIKGATVTQSK